jgi:hypothetical protein
MDQYSQPYLKVAASEPEHVVRKAEFDSALGSYRTASEQDILDAEQNRLIDDLATEVAGSRIALENLMTIIS